MITLALIGKDETEDFNRLLDNVQPHVAEVVLVANGNDPGFEGAMEKRGVKVFREPVPKFHTTYGHFDFASARNSSFAKATQPVTLWLDKDDVLDHPERLPELAKDVASGKVDWIYLEYIYARDKYGNVVARHWRPRLVRTGTGVWEKTVHENLVPTTAIINGEDRSIRVLHDFTEEDGRKSAERNMGLLMAEYLADGEKTDPRTLLYLGNTLFGLERCEEAVRFYVEHIKRTGSEEDKFWSLVNAAKCLNKLGDFKRALGLALEAARVMPAWATAYFVAGESCIGLGEYRQAKEWLKTGFAKERPQTLLPTNDLDYTVLPLGRLAYAYLHTSEYGKAQKIAERLTELAPAMPEVVELAKITDEVMELEDFVKAWILVAGKVASVDRSRAVKLFDNLPDSLSDDIRIQTMRQEIVLPKIWPKKSVVFLCGNSPEEWADPSLLSGIGGSETATIFLSRIFAKRGYKVTVYNRCGEMAGVYNGVTYKPFIHFNPQDTFDVLIVWRNAAVYETSMRARRKYLWLHDRPHRDGVNDRILANLDKIIVMSNYQRWCLSDVPDDKFLISKNGINVAELETIDGERIKRNPKKIVWGSSYDRGLEHFLDIYEKVKREVPDVEASVFYGWQGFDKAHAGKDREMAWKAAMIKRMEDLGVKDLGRISHKDVLREFASAGIWLYPTGFWEISCIQAMQAQAMGALPVTTDYAALNETVQRGVKVGGVTEFLVVPDKVKEEMAEAVVGLLTTDNKDEQTAERQDMVDWARETYDWSEVADQWEGDW